MSDLYKYPRTYHVPFSPGLQNDDRCHPDMSIFDDKRVIVSIKMDGENTTWYNDAIHARSLDSHFANHGSRDYVKRMWASKKYLIPNDVRVCGENLYAIHSIEYDELESYFQVFSAWNNNICYSWKDTLVVCDMISEKPVEVIYDGIYDVPTIKHIFETFHAHEEGYVIRVADGFIHNFETDYFFLPMAKYVRKNHIQTDKHWMKNWNKTLINKLEK